MQKNTLYTEACFFMSNIFTRLFSREARKEATKASVQTTIIEDASVVVSSPTVAQKVAAVYSCVRILSSTVAKLPLEYKRRKFGTYIFVDYIESPLYHMFVRRPSKWHTSYVMWSKVVAQMLLQGNAYAYIRRVGSQVSEIILLSPGACSYDESAQLYYVNDPIHRVAGVFGPEDILHFANIDESGSVLGKSTIAYAAEVLSIQATADKETKKRFSTGGKIKALFTNDTSVKGFGEYTDDALAEGAADIENKINSGQDIIPVPGDGKLLPLSMSSTDMELLSNKKFGIREICRFFRVPPSKIYDDYSHAYNAGETAAVEFLTDSIDPLLTQIEQELEAKLLPEDLFVAQHFKFLFDREKMFTVNSITEADYLTKMVAVGALTVNDVRRKRNMMPVEGGDVAMISCNVAPLTSAKITGEEKSGQPLVNNSDE